MGESAASRGWKRAPWPQCLTSPWVTGGAGQDLVCKAFCSETPFQENVWSEWRGLRCLRWDPGTGGFGARSPHCVACVSGFPHIWWAPPTSGHHTLLVPARAGPAVASMETRKSQPRLLPRLSGPRASLAPLGLAVSSGKFPGFNLRICRPSSSRNVTGGVSHMVEEAPGESRAGGWGFDL